MKVCVECLIVARALGIGDPCLGQMEDCATLNDVLDDTCFEAVKNCAMPSEIVLAAETPPYAIDVLDEEDEVEAPGPDRLELPNGALIAWLKPGARLHRSLEGSALHLFGGLQEPRAYKADG